MMAHRERVLAEVEHRQPDRLPLDQASARFTRITPALYDTGWAI